MELSAYYAGHHMIGEPDARGTDLRSEVYLLDASYWVLSARAEQDTQQVLDRGFFDLFPAADSEREALEDYLRGYDHSCLLLQTKKTPVLFIGCFFKETGLMLAVVPLGRVQQVLCRPALFDRVPESLRISRGGLARYALPGEEERELVARWYVSVSTPFLFGAEQSGGEGLLRALALRATRLTELLGCRLAFDFTGLGLRPTDVIDIALYTGVLTAALMAASRMGGERTVRMRLQHDFGVGVMLYAELRRADGQDPLAELRPVALAAQNRGAILDAVCLPEDLYRIELRASLSPIELSLQGTKERHPLLNGRSVFGLAPHEILFDEEL